MEWSYPFTILAIFAGRKLLLPFGSTKHFLDLQFTKKDHEIVSNLMESLIEERYYISKYTHTSYKDIDNITPFERKVLIRLISDDISARNKAHEDAIKSIKEM